LFEYPKEEKKDRFLSPYLEENIMRYTKLFGEKSDLTVRRLQYNGRNKIAVMYIDTLVEKDNIDRFVIHELKTHVKELFESPILDPNILSTNKVVELITNDKITDYFLQGYSIIFLDGQQIAYAAETSGGERRPVSESNVETVVRGPRESFNESWITNIGLIRKRIHTSKLHVHKLELGEESKTTVAVLSIKDIAKEKIVKEVISRLDQIQIDGILDSLYIEEIIEDPNGYTPFPTIFNSERPDRIAAGLLEGRIAIIVDGTPVVLMVPATIGLFLAANEDYYQRYDFATFLKLLRVFTFILSFVLPGLYVALLTFHQEMIPTPLLIAITGQREGVPFEIALEVLFMEITFEILREAGLRLPKTIGAAVSIVGGLVLGQAAVEAGLVGQSTVIAVSITAICSFTTPSYNIAITARMLRFFLLILSAALGAFGLIFGLLFLFIHLNSLRSFSVPYLTPLVPFHKTNWRDLFVRAPWWKMEQRPDEIAGDNHYRMPPGTAKRNRLHRRNKKR